MTEKERGEAREARVEVAAAGDAPDQALRQKAVDLLCEAFADDVVPVEEFERRVDLAHRAPTVGDLRALLADLPGRSLPVPSAASTGPDEPGASTSDPDGNSAALRDPPVRVTPADQVREQSFLGGVFGGGSRKGTWAPARTNWCVGIMGGVQLDFRDAIFPPGVTEVRTVAFWGGVEIIAPPGVRIELDGIAIMGGFDLDASLPPPTRADAPVLRLSGWALMGGVQVHVRRPGESARDARRRTRLERKATRRLSRGGDR